jgi:membrane protein implicated in regulation of membrane protease activity
MFVFILVLLLIAAIFGVLGAVLKAALVLALGLILAFTVVIWGGWWYAKRRMRDWQRDMDRRIEETERRRRAIDVRRVPNEADGERGQGAPLELEGGEAPHPGSGPSA